MCVRVREFLLVCVWGCGSVGVLCPVSCPIVSDRLCVGVCAGLCSMLCNNANISPTPTHTYTNSRTHLHIVCLYPFSSILAFSLYCNPTILAVFGHQYYSSCFSLTFFLLPSLVQPFSYIWYMLMPIFIYHKCLDCWSTFSTFLTFTVCVCVGV